MKDVAWVMGHACFCFGPLQRPLGYVLKMYILLDETTAVTERGVHRARKDSLLSERPSDTVLIGDPFVIRYHNALFHMA